MGMIERVAYELGGSLLDADALRWSLAGSAAAELVESGGWLLQVMDLLPSMERLARAGESAMLSGPAAGWLIPGPGSPVWRAVAPLLGEDVDCADAWEVWADYVQGVWDRHGVPVADGPGTELAARAAAGYLIATAELVG